MDNKIVLKRLALILIVALGLIVFLSSSTKPNIDSLPGEASDIDYSSQVNFVEAEELFEALGSVEQQNRLSKDLYFFAKNAYSPYSGDVRVIGFKPHKSIKKSDGKITFSGNFGAVGQDINVEVSLLSHSRVSTSITDTKTKLNIDDFLPSKNKRDLFIGSLPIETKDYVIDYVSEDDSFIINVFNSSVNFAKAEATLKEKLGISSLDEDRFIKYGAGDADVEGR